MFLTEDPEIVLRCGTKRLGAGKVVVCSREAAAAAEAAVAAAEDVAWRPSGAGVTLKVGVGA